MSPTFSHLHLTENPSRRTCVVATIIARERVLKTSYSTIHRPSTHSRHLHSTVVHDWGIEPNSRRLPLSRRGSRQGDQVRHDVPHELAIKDIQNCKVCLASAAVLASLRHCRCCRRGVGSTGVQAAGRVPVEMAVPGALT